MRLPLLVLWHLGCCCLGRVHPRGETAAQAPQYTTLSRMSACIGSGRTPWHQSRQIPHRVTSARKTRDYESMFPGVFVSQDPQD